MKLELYFPLTIWNKEKQEVRELTKEELAYENEVIEKLTRRFDSVKIIKATSTCLRENKVIRIKNDILTIYCHNCCRVEHRHFLVNISTDIKKKLNQESIFIAEDLDAENWLDIPE